MEAVGLGVGIVGLAGLFSTVLQTVDGIQDYRSFTTDAHTLKAQLDGHRALLERWGRDVGLSNGKLSVAHHANVDTEIVSAAEQLLQIANDTLTSSEFSPERNDTTVSGRRRLADVVSSKKQKIGWALQGKAKRTEQVQLFGEIVRQLTKLIPTNKAGLKLRASDRQNGMLPAPGLGGSDVESQKGIQEVLNELSGIRRLVARMAEERKAETQRMVNIWLLGKTVSNDRYFDSLQKRLEGTCDWILNRPEFTQWASREHPTTEPLLWIHGHAGFGKTVLCARVIEHLSVKSNAPVAHFFFTSDIAGLDDPYLVLRSWTSQLALRDAEAFDLACQKWYNTVDQVTAPRPVVVELFQEILQAVPNCTLVLDGLDECIAAREGQKNLGNMLQDMGKSLSSSSRVLIVSRDEPDIRHALEDDCCAGLVEIKISTEDVRGDTTALSQHIVNRKLPKKSEEIRRNLSQVMSQQCDGQFLWLMMQEGSLRKGMNHKELQRAIDETPAGLDQIYERNWMTITNFPERDRTRAFALLRWAAFSLRPLTVSEMAEAVLLDESCEDFPIDCLPDSIDEDYIDSEMKGLCGPLLDLRSRPAESSVGQTTVHIAHFTVKQYLIIHLPTRTLQANENLSCSNERLHGTILAQLCLRYISSPSAWDVAKPSQPPVFQKFFRRYAAGVWHSHFRSGVDGDINTSRLIKSFMNDDNSSWKSWRRWFDHQSQDEETKELLKTESVPPKPHYYAIRLGLTDFAIEMVHSGHVALSKEKESRPALHLACRGGHLALVEALLDGGAAIEGRAYKGRTPLYMAALNGRTEVVNLLLSHGANISTTDDFGVTPVHVATANAHLETIKLLVEKGADIEFPGTNGWTPLHAAAAKGLLETVKLLVNSGANIAARNEKESTPLHMSAAYGHLDTTRFLLAQGADISAMDNIAFSPFAAAVSKGWLPVAQLLLDKGSDLLVTDIKGSNPLHLATIHNFPQVVQFLLEKGSDMTVANGLGWVPIHAAASKGSIDSVRLFLDRGQSISTLNTHGSSPLLIAAAYGHCALAKFLLDNGADLSAVDNDGYSALVLAVESGNIDLVHLLLDRGADSTVVPTKGGTALHLAASRNRLDIAQLLTKRGADVCQRNRTDGTPLIAASWNGHCQMVEFLLRQGADTSVQNNIGWTALHAAACNGHTDVTEALLQHGADHSILNSLNSPPLYTAAFNGHHDTVEKLLDYGSSLSCASGDGEWTPLHAASFNGKYETVELLLRRGADVSSLTGYGVTALQLAAGANQTEIVSFLLDNGADMENSDTNGSNALFMATYNGHVEAVRLLLDRGANIEAVLGPRQTALHKAAVNGKSEVTKLLLQRGASVTAVDDSLYTPLHLAAAAGHADVVKLLLDNKSDVSAPTEKKYHPIHLAAVQGHLEVVQMLLSHGADVTHKDDFEATPLSCAAGGGCLEMAKVLLGERTCDPFSNKDIVMCMFLAVRHSHSEIIQWFLDKGCPPNVMNGNHWTLIHEAATYDQLDVARLLLDRGASCSAKNDDGQTPLHCAAYKGHVRMAELLLQHGADVSEVNLSGWTPLCHAAANGHSEMVQFLLDKGSALLHVTTDGWTPTHLAAAYGHIDTLRLFVETDPGVISAEQQKRSALGWASTKGHLEIVRFLLQKGAKASDAGLNGWNALHSSARHGHTQVARLLIDEGADISAPGPFGWTPLHAAAYGGHIETMQYLLDKGASPLSTTGNDLTPLHTSVEGNSLASVQFLLGVSQDLVNKADLHGRTALFNACRFGYADIVRALVHEEGIQCTLSDCYHTMPLHAAVINGHCDVVELLLATDDHSTVFTDSGKTPRPLVWWSERSRDTGVVEILQRYAEKLGTQFKIEEPTTQSDPQQFDSKAPWCAACTTSIDLKQSTRYLCQSCNKGAVYICEGCFTSGFRCRDESHELVQQNPSA